MLFKTVPLLGVYSAAAVLRTTDVAAANTASISIRRKRQHLISCLPVVANFVYVFVRIFRICAARKRVAMKGVTPRQTKIDATEVENRKIKKDTNEIQSNHIK